MILFKLARIKEAIADFDYAEQLEPTITPYLWQRGLAYYYDEQYEQGAKQFELDLTVNSRDVEETVWRYLCLARYQGVDTARNTLLVVNNDPRPTMCQVYHLYTGNCSIEDVLAVGKQEGKKGNFYSHLYIGLYYEVEQDENKAKEYIVQAVNNYKLHDYMWYLACVHQKLRQWA
jgi:tetratricopeptide (TPR) repeat protein